ncbi:MAG: hypothetical protein FRX49_09858, partial [Trebouxia sp. A1-2]
EKEQELQKLNAARVSVLEEQLHGLEEQVSERDTEIEKLQEQLVQLTEDFRYNLKLLEERDAELERTEASLEGYKKGGQAREADLMETRHKLDEVQQQLQERSSHAAQQEHQHSQAVARLTQDLQQEQQARQQEGKASADSLADLKASAARELAEVRKQAKEQLQQSGSEAQVKLAAVQSARMALQGQVEKLQDSNGALHQQLADAHGKIESQAVELARMLEQFEGSVAALREMERQYGSLQELSQRGQQASAGRIADLEREAADSRDIHLALAAQHETKIAELSRDLSQTTQKLEAMQRLYEAESAVARQSAEHNRRDSEQMSRLEGRLAEALALTDAAEQAKDLMEQQLHAAQASEEGSMVALEREVELHTQTQAEKLEAQQQAEEYRAQVTGIQAEMRSLPQLGHAATRPAPSPAPLQPLHNPGVAACHPLQSVLGARSDAASNSQQQQQWVQEGSRWHMAGETPNRGGSAGGPMPQGHAGTNEASELRKRVSDLAGVQPMLHSADDAGGEPHTSAHQSHKLDDDLMRQQQRMIDLLKLRSDELSAENGKLRLQVASESKQWQPPEQLPNDFISSHAAMSMQQWAQMQPPSPSRLAQVSGLSAFPKTSDLSRLREQVMTAKDQLLQLDLSPVLASGTAASRRPRTALVKQMLHMPRYA